MHVRVTNQAVRVSLPAMMTEDGKEAIVLNTQLHKACDAQGPRVRSPNPCIFLFCPGFFSPYHVSLILTLLLPFFILGQIALVAVIGDSMGLVIKRPGLGKFKCHLFQLDSPAQAAELCATIQKVTTEAFKMVRARCGLIMSSVSPDSTDAIQ